MRMPSRVLLISANRCTTPDPVFPLGLACLNAALRRAGHQTAWLDRLVNTDRLAETLRQFRPDFVGISLRNIDDVLIRQQEVFFDELVSLQNDHPAAHHRPRHSGRQRLQHFPGATPGTRRRRISASPAKAKRACSNSSKR